MATESTEPVLRPATEDDRSLLFEVSQFSRHAAIENDGPLCLMCLMSLMSLVYVGCVGCVWCISGASLVHLWCISGASLVYLWCVSDVSGVCLMYV